MKKNKFAFFVITFLIIFLVQPKNREFLVSTFTQNDFPSQFGFTNSAEEKNFEIENHHQNQNLELARKEFEGVQIIDVNPQSQFSNEELSLEKGSWKKFSDLDFLGRVREANAMLGPELLAKKERKNISNVRPSGWKNKKIEVNGEKDYLYNRSHLIAFQLSGENDNPKNIFTGTRFLNANFAPGEKNSMVYFENQIVNYIKTTGHHVRYRVTPIFRNVELVCRGVRIEAQSIEDNSISFDCFIFNIQPEYDINYLTGTSQKVSK